MSFWRSRFARGAAPRSTLRPRHARLSLLHLGDFIGDQPMRFAMHGDRGLFVGSFNQAKGLAALLVEPVAQVFDAVLLLRSQVGLMGLGCRGSGEPFDISVDVHKEWHAFSP